MGKKRKKVDEAPDTQGSGSGLPERPEKQAKLSKVQGKAKAPLDLDKNCGVLLDNGLQCTRSITCKIHTVSAKRAVPGRSMQYDMLVSDYNTQRTGGARPGAKGDNKFGPGSRPGGAAPSFPGGQPMTQEEEVQMVLKAIIEHKPQPLALPTPCASFSRWPVYKNRLALQAVLARRDHVS
ncbi:hypothetical protein HDV00_009417 [Rhizophlyctis rosea]|nr:hypothetical protein HDV00_009417 [Rhizophlyctis rosea]